MRAIDDLEQSQRKFLSEISNIQSKFIEQRHDFIAFKKNNYFSWIFIIEKVNRIIWSTIIEYANGRMERLQDKLETTDRDLGKFKQKSSFKLSHIGNIQNNVKEPFHCKKHLQKHL